MYTREMQVTTIDTASHSYSVFWALLFCDLACVPSRNPFRNHLWTRRRCFILPVPVVCLLLAFTLQLSAERTYPR